MYSRQSPSRNQRSKGIKVKHILQICLLLAVSFWLIYQVKHSHDKKKEFDETDTKTALNSGVNNGLIKLGRKDLPGVQENDSKSDNHDEDTEEEEITAEEEENKKVAEEEEEDEVLDEHETTKLIEDEDQNEIEEKGSEDSFKHTEKEISDGDDKDESHDARDENYKADDASSAVTHDIQTVTTDNTTVHRANITGEENEVNNSVESSKIELPSGLEVENDEVATENNQSNLTISQIKEKSSTDAENVSSLNNTQGSETESDNANHNEDNDSTERSNSRIINNSTLDVDDKHFDTNSTVTVQIKGAELISDEFSSNSKDSTRSNTEENETVDAENSGITDEVLASEMDENHEDVQIDAIDLSDPSDSLEMKHVRNNLETLPEVQTQGTDSED